MSFDDPRYGPRRGPGPSPVLGLLLILVVALLLWSVAAKGFFGGGSLYDPDAQGRAITPRGDLAADELATIELFKTSSPSVVHITTLEARRSLFSMNVDLIPAGTGSGFVWDRQGYIVTNFHVLAGADRAIVVLKDQSEYDARYVGSMPDFDLAVLKIDAPENKLAPIRVGTSKDLQVGQKVFAIGNPFGLDHTLTTGVISGLEREIQSVTGRAILGVIQTDAAINPGNSGGPLLDSAGLLIGVNTAIKSPSGASAGIGFAVPVDTVNSAVPQIISNGQKRRGVLGVELAPDAVARQFGVQGAVIRDVVPGSPAQQAGLIPLQREGRQYVFDRIVEFDGRPVRNSQDLLEALARSAPGEEVELEVARGRSLRRVTCRLQ